MKRKPHKINRRRTWEPEMNLDPESEPKPDKDGKVELPIRRVKWMSAERWHELAQANAEAYEIMKRAVEKVRRIHRKARINTDSALLGPFLRARSETSADKEPRFNLDLDRHSSALLRRALPKALPQELFNLINGAAACTLEAALDHRLVTLREAIAEAGARRLAEAMKPAMNDEENDGERGFNLQ
jgi:hypothetical protein